MRNIIKKERFGPVQFGERLGSFAFLLIGSGIGHRCCHMSGDHLEEIMVGFIKDPTRIDSYHEKAGHLMLFWGFQGQDQRLVGRFGPWTAWKHAELLLKRGDEFGGCL